MAQPMMVPTATEGHRRLFCAGYDGCLDYAARRHWEGFSCPADCPDYHPIQWDREEWLADNRACLCLLLVALKPKLFEYVSPSSLILAMEREVREHQAWDYEWFQIARL